MGGFESDYINFLIDPVYTALWDSHLYSLTVNARELKFWENVHPHHVSKVICHVSHVRCHMSGVMCLVSYVWYQMYLFLLYLDKAIGLVRWGCVINLAYPSSFQISMVHNLPLIPVKIDWPICSPAFYQSNFVIAYLPLSKPCFTSPATSARLAAILSYILHSKSRDNSVGCTAPCCSDLYCTEQYQTE